jgi:membrane protein DedA with SNARE-associated domain
MIEYFITLLTSWSEALPLPLFTFLGALIEEIIAPIPSPFVMTLSGSFAEAQGQNLLFLMLLALVGTIGKTIGCWVIYLIAAKFEDVVTGRFGKFLGVTDKQVEKISKRLENNKHEALAIFLLRAAPIMPTSPVSLMAGVLKLDLRRYLLSSAAGVFVRNLFYLYLGYSSTNALENINDNLNSLETIGYVLMLVFFAGLIGYIYKKRREF